MKLFKCVIFSVLMLVLAPSFAIELDEVIVGAIYYHDEWNNNTKVRVIDIRGHKVEILFLEGSNIGEVDRVYPSYLLTRTDSEEEAAEDFKQAVGITVIGVGLFVCFMNPEACK